MSLYPRPLTRHYLITLLLTAIAAPVGLSAQTIFTAGTVNSADYSRSFAPGAIISIFGTNLSASTAQATSMPLPVSLGGASVMLVGNAEQMPLFYVSPGQINAQLPYDVVPGQVQLKVVTAAGSSAADTITVSVSAPKFFTLNLSGTGSAIATTPNYSVLTATSPAKPADMIVLWMNSMGPTTGSPVAGQAAPGLLPGQTAATLTTTPNVTINGTAAPVTFAGLAPGAAGLYQINVQAPFVTLTGLVTIQVTVGTASAQANVTIPFRQLGFYYSLLGGKPVASQTLNAVSGATSSLAFQQSDAVTWGSTGLNAWTDNTGLGSVYSGTPGLAITLLNGSTIVYDNNGIETNTAGTFYNNTAGPADSQKPGLTDLYSMSNYFPLVFSGYFKLTQATTITELVGYFDPGGSTTLPFDPANPFVKYRMNIWSIATGELPTETNNFVGNVFTSDTTAGTFAYSDTKVQMVSSLSTNSPKDIYRLTYTLATPITLQPGEYWLSHDASVRSTVATSSTANSISVDELRDYISSQHVEDQLFRFSLFGQNMSLRTSWTMAPAIQVRPSAPIAPR